MKREANTSSNPLVIGVFMIGLLLSFSMGITGNSIIDWFFDEPADDTNEENEGNWITNLFGLEEDPPTNSAKQGNDPPKPGETWNGLAHCNPNEQMPPKPQTDTPKPLPTPNNPEPPRSQPKTPTKPEQTCEECLGSELTSIIPRNTETGEKIYEKACRPKKTKQTCETVKPAAKGKATYCSIQREKKSSHFRTFPSSHKDKFWCETKESPGLSPHGGCDEYYNCEPRDFELEKPCAPAEKPCWKYAGYHGDTLEIRVEGCGGIAAPTDPKLLPTCEWKNETNEGEIGWTTNMTNCEVIGEGDEAHCTGGCFVQYLYPENNCEPKEEDKTTGICDLKCQEMKKKTQE